MIRNCFYVKADGRRCGSPALHDRNFCYFHYQVNRPRATVPPLENADAIQIALTDLARAVLAETVDLKRAKVLTYILQTASSNLRRGPPWSFFTLAGLSLSSPTPPASGAHTAA